MEIRDMYRKFMGHVTDFCKNKIGTCAEFPVTCPLISLLIIQVRLDYF